MFNLNRMKRLLVKNLLTSVSMEMKGLAFVAAFSSVVMIFMAYDGQLAFLHAFSMMCIAGAFVVLAEVSDAVRDSVNEV